MEPRVFNAIGAPEGHRVCAWVKHEVPRYSVMRWRCECGRLFALRGSLANHHAAVVDGEGRVTT